MEEWIALSWGLNRLKSLARFWEQNDTPTWVAQSTGTSVSSHSAHGRQVVSPHWHSFSPRLHEQHAQYLNRKGTSIEDTILIFSLVAISCCYSAQVSIAICRYISFNGQRLLRYLGRDPMTGTDFADFYSIWYWTVMEISMMYFFGVNTPSKILCVLVAGASSPFPKHTHIAKMKPAQSRILSK